MRPTLSVWNEKPSVRFIAGLSARRIPEQGGLLVFIGFWGHVELRAWLGR